MKITKWGPVLVFGLLAFLATSPVHADTVYTYTGTPFTSCYGTYTCTSAGPRITITFDLTTPLPANLPYATDVIAIIQQEGNYGGVNMSDGTFGAGLADSFTLDVGTDANGNINQWSVFAAPPAGEMGSYYVAGQSRDFIDIFSDNYGGFAGGGSTNSGPGTWTVTTTPEPSTLILLGAGLLGLALIGVRR